VAAAAVALLAAIGLAAARPRSVPVVLAERRPVVQRVVASGRVMPPSRIRLASLALARVRTVEVEEGTRVAPGQVLARLDDAEARAALAQADGRVGEARARLEQVRGVGSKQATEALRQAELGAAKASRDLERTRELYRGGSASAAELDQAEKAFEVARSQQESAAAQAMSAATGAEYRLAAASLRQAQGARDAAEARLDQTVLRAPAAALVIARRVEPGDVVRAGEELLVLARDGETLLTANPDEKNLALLRTGQAAIAAADAFPDRTFAAAVSFVGPAVDPARGTVEVRLRVAEPPPFLRPDMTVSVNVEVGQRAEAIVIPADAVRDAAGDAWVLVVSNGRAERRSVKLGLRGDGLVEVLEGLAPGDAVVPASAGSVAPGERVRGRAPPPAPGSDRAV
jgi:HlyD family secretion protein